jgi:predicted transcriptional regulator of viral defense system
MQSSLAAVARRVPGAVVCLLSALRVHDLTTQAPFETWIAIPTRARTPKLDGLPVRVVRMAKAPLAAGVAHRKIDGVQVPVFDLEKTVVDCFRFRNRIGLDVALEAMREYVRRPRRNVERLLHYAAVDRVAKAIRPYLQAML